MKKLILSLLAALGLTSSCSAEGAIKVLSPADYTKAVKADSVAVILDVRRPIEFISGHLEGAVSLDFLNPDAFNTGLKQLDKTKHYYVYCRSGKRSHAAAEKMLRQGFKVFDMEGGILNWIGQGFPTVKGASDGTNVQ